MKNIFVSLSLPGGHGDALSNQEQCVLWMLRIGQNGRAMFINMVVMRFTTQEWMDIESAELPHFDMENNCVQLF